MHVVLLRDVNRMLALDARIILRKEKIAATMESCTNTTWNVMVPEEELQRAEEVLSHCDL